MLSRREKILINLLLWIVLFVAFGLFLFTEARGRVGRGEKIALMEAQIARLNIRIPDRELLESRRNRTALELSEEKKRFYHFDEIDPYSFGAAIRDLIVSEGLTIIRYRTIDAQDNPMLEFVVSGDTHDFFSFLKLVSISEKNWYIPFLSVKAETLESRVHAVFRITYATIG
jgi:hypothetical protein